MKINNEELLMSFDYMCAMLISYDNNSRHPSLYEDTTEIILEIRKLIKNRKEKANKQLLL